MIAGKDWLGWKRLGKIGGQPKTDLPLYGRRQAPDLNAGGALEIAHLQFRFRTHTLAFAARVRASGQVEIELGFGNPGTPASLFTAAQLRAAEAEIAKRRRAGPARAALR